MADAIRQKFDVEAKLIAGGGGIFDVRLHDELIFSKHQIGRFPEHQEVLDRLATRTRNRSHHSR